MALAMELMVDGCKIRVFDDYCVRKSEEIDAILAKVARIYYESNLEKALHEAEEESKKNAI